LFASQFRARYLVKAHMPYLLIILLWAVIYQAIYLMVEPTLNNSLTLLGVGIIVFIYVLYKTRENRRKAITELKNKNFQ